MCRVIAVTTYFKVPAPPEKSAPMAEQLKYDALEKFHRPLTRTLMKLSHAAVQEVISTHFPTMDIETVANECCLCTSSEVGPDYIFYPIKEVGTTEE